MSKGVVLFAFNTESYDYVKMAKYCASRINYFLNLPVTLITNDTLADKQIFDQIINVEANIKNKKEGKIWINKDRYKAFELSPYDETILLDVDYVVNSDKLLKLFTILKDICVHNHTEFVMQPNLPQEFLSPYSEQIAWATVIAFKKTNKAKQVFECIKMVQNNYQHYTNVYNFVAGTYRNDYALGIALRIVNGHLNDKHDFIPWSLLHVGKNTSIYPVNNELLCSEFISLFDNWKNGKIKKEYAILKNIDFHMINKENFLEIVK